MYKPIQPLDPIKGILDFFHSHNLLALSEGVTHGDEQGHAFIRALISDPRFPVTVNDIVVEWGNSLYQELLDQYLEGVDVPYEKLQQVWQNTTQPHEVWDKPVYETFFRTVRNINQSLSKDKKIRVFLGDPPIDWEKINSKDDYIQFFNDVKTNRDTYPANLIQEEIIRKNRRALIIYGGMHLQRKNMFTNYEESEHPLLLSILEKYGNNIFNIWGTTDLDKLQIDVSSWKMPCLIMLRGTLLGATDFTWYYPYDVKRQMIKDGKITDIERDQWQDLSMENQFEAIMYYGSSSTITYSQILPSICTDEYIKMRIKRMILCGFPPSEIDRKKIFYQKLRDRR